METDPTRHFATKLGLGLILAAGFGLRLWYGGFGLQLSRFEDEKHSWPNVQAILETGTLAPEKTYYPYPLFNVPPAVLIAAVEQLSSSTGEAQWKAVAADGTVTPRALFLCRAGPIFYGTVAILLTFLVGQRVFSGNAGLVGALLLAFSPQAIHSSGYFKPDSQLLCMTLLALLLALRAVERPSLVRYMLAGIGVTLAASSKAIGVVVAGSLLVATLITGWRRHRDLLWLGVAGLTSALLFILVNPYWRVYPAWLANIRYHYAIRAKAEGATQAMIPWKTLDFLVEPSVQNPWLSGLGLVGLVALVIWLLRHRRLELRWLGRLMFLVFPVVYVATYAATTAYFKSNNFLVLLPFVFLAAGWVLSSAWSRIADSWKLLQRPVLRLPAWALLAILAASPGLVYTYSSLVPPTHLLAKGFLARNLESPDGRLVYLEDPHIARPEWEGWPRQFARDRAAFRQVDSADEISREALALADGLAVTSASLEGSGSAPLSRWLGDLPPSQIRTFEPRPLRARGPSMIAAYQRIHQLEGPLALEIEACPRQRQCLFATLQPELGPDEIISVIVYVRQAHFERGAPLPEVRLGGGDLLDLTWASWRRDTREHHFVSSRTALGESEPRLQISLEGWRLSPAEFRVELCRWRMSDQS